MPRPALAALCSALLLIPSVGYAQRHPLKTGMQAKVSTGTTMSQGTVTRISGDTVWLSSRGTQTAVLLRPADSLWIRRTLAGRSALGGGVTGGVVLGGFFALLATGLCEANCSNVAPKGFLVGSVIGGGAGAMLGAIVGSLFRHWSPVAASR
jgi:hypothetical protein